MSGEGFLRDGEFVFGLITKKYSKHFVVTGHRIPTDLSENDQERVFKEVAHASRNVDYFHGPLDFDVRVMPERVTIIEMSPGLEGNGIPMIIERATDFDLISSTVLFALGENVCFSSREKIIADVIPSFSDRRRRAFLRILQRQTR